MARGRKARRILNGGRKSRKPRMDARFCGRADAAKNFFWIVLYVLIKPIRFEKFDINFIELEEIY